MYRKLSLILFSLILATYYMLHTTGVANALNMRNTSWILQMGSVNNNFAGTKSNGTYKLRDTGGQIAPGFYSGTGGRVRAGFEYVESIIPFSFKILGEGVSRIDFGSLTPTTPSFRQQNLSVYNGSAGGFVVTLIENHALLVPSSGKFIPNTTCDAGGCTTTNATLWSGSLVYGFGIRCDQVGLTNYCPSDFSTTNFYRPIADNSLSQSPATIMSGVNVGRNMQVTITYKVNVSATQTAGLYTNTLTYVATPTF